MTLARRYDKTCEHIIRTERAAAKCCNNGPRVAVTIIMAGPGTGKIKTLSARITH